MKREGFATFCTSAGAALLFGTAVLHLMAYRSVVGRAPGDLQPLVGASWVAGGVSLILAALLAVTVTPLFMARRRVRLVIAALTPLSIAILQIIYLGFIPPTALLLANAGVLLAAAALGPAGLPSEQRAA